MLETARIGRTSAYWLLNVGQVDYFADCREPVTNACAVMLAATP
jgi:hypothetical protein